MNTIEKTLTEVIDGGYLDYAMYTLQSRAIPSAIDGLKPVTRKLLYAMLTEHGSKRVKLADLGGISKYSYDHGESSAIEAAGKLAQDWNNNAPLFEQHGNFGSRLVQETAGPRYIHVSLSENYKKFFVDVEIAPPAFDLLNPEPCYYLPIVPWVLVNGIGGMAVGFKTEVLPRSIKDILAATKKCLSNREKFIAENEAIKPTFPSFSGNMIQKSPSQWITQGTITYSGKYTYDISELPVGYDRATYLTLLNDLRDKELIKDFEDNCSKEGFGFKVKVTILQKTEIDKNPIKYFSLEKTHTEILTTMGTNGKIKIFDSVAELIVYFCDFRTKKFSDKIEYDKQKLSSEIELLMFKKKFIKDVVMNKIDFRKSSKADLLQYIADNVTSSEYGKSLIRIPLYECTPEEVKTLIAKIENLKCDLSALDEIDGSILFNQHLKRVKL